MRNSSEPFGPVAGPGLKILFDAFRAGCPVGFYFVHRVFTEAVRPNVLFDEVALPALLDSVFFFLIGLLSRPCARPPSWPSVKKSVAELSGVCERVVKEPV